MTPLALASRRVAATIVSVLGMTVAIVAVPVDSPMSGADSWVRSLSRAERMSVLAPNRLSLLPDEYRRALSRADATPEERMEFWRSIFAAFRADKTLSAEQEGVVAEAESLIPAAFGSEADKPAVAARLLSIRARLVSALGEDGSNQLLLAAGGRRAQSSGLPLLERIRYSWRSNRPEALVAALGFVFPAVHASGTCNCGYPGDCTYHQECGAPVECEPYEPPICGLGCGSWGCYGCWMLCYYPG